MKARKDFCLRLSVVCGQHPTDDGGPAPNLARTLGYIRVTELIFYKGQRDARPNDFGQHYPSDCGSG